MVYNLSDLNYYYFMLLFTAVFAVTANLDYLLRILKGKIKKGGSSIAHIGFGLIMLGALISTGTSDVISQNTSGIDITKLGDDFSNNDNIMLTKGDTLKMGEYYVTYSGKYKEGINIYFNIDYLTKGPNGEYNKAFSLKPLVQLNKEMGNVAEPDTRHFLTEDIYTHITYADLELVAEDIVKNKNEYNDPKDFSMGVGDSIFSSNSIIILESLDVNLDKSEYGLNEGDIIVSAKIKAIDMKGEIAYAEPIYTIVGRLVKPIEDSIPKLGLKFSFNEITPETGEVNIALSEKPSNKKEFVIMKAIVFPYINVLWTGAILLIIGTMLAITQRIKSARTT